MLQEVFVIDPLKAVKEEDKGGGNGDGKEGGKGGGGEKDWQFKGEGKGGSLGTSVGSGSIVDAEVFKRCSMTVISNILKRLLWDG